ncbi:MAG: type 1 glutamine amidotransferase [Rubripirellula sp.]
MSGIRILVVQHSAADSLAAAQPVLDILGHEVVTVRIDRKDPIPKSVECDAMITLGGPYGLTAEKIPEWIADEQALIRKYVDQDRRVMGICLGSQILASALGANVRRNEQPEVGWHKVSRVSDQSAIANAAFTDQMTVFQWHQDTFEIPSGAIQLFESATCVNQSYSIDERIFGFQFHLEANERTIRTFMAVSPLLKRRCESVQTESEILEGVPVFLPRQVDRLTSFLCRFLPN